MSLESRLAALEKELGPAEAAGPVVIVYGCTPDTDPRPAVPRPGASRVCLAAGEELPAWVGPHRVFLPAEIGPNDMIEEEHATVAP